MDRGQDKQEQDFRSTLERWARPISLTGEDAKLRDWSVFFRSCGGFVNKSLTTPLPHTEAADPAAFAISVQVNETILAASLHLVTGPALDKVVTSGDGEGLSAWHSLVSVSEMEDYERAVRPFQYVSDETVSSAMKVGTALNRLGDTASLLVMTAERLKECHDFKTEVINKHHSRTSSSRRRLHLGRQEHSELWYSTNGRCQREQAGSRTRVMNLSQP